MPEVPLLVSIARNKKSILKGAKVQFFCVIQKQTERLHQFFIMWKKLLIYFVGISTLFAITMFSLTQNCENSYNIEKLKAVKQVAIDAVDYHNSASFAHAEKTTQQGTDLLQAEMIPIVDFSPVRECATIGDFEIEAALEAYQLKVKVAHVKSEIASQPGMIGRLIVPDANIDVALFSVSAQSDSTEFVQIVTDAPDSCAYITDLIPGTAILADHNTQGFRGLTQVVPGTKGMIITATETFDIVATQVFDGHNYGILTDNNGTPISSIANYIAYTCRDVAQNVRIVGFDITFS